MKGLYISCDIEASGRVPPRYNMLSIGMCVVGREDVNFYRELKPLNINFQIEAFKIGALHLECLPREPQYCARSAKFNPEKTMCWLREHAKDPLAVMQEADKWVRSVVGTHQPILTTDAQPFDGSFVQAYFIGLLDSSPFDHKGRNLDELYRGIRNDADANLRDLKIPDTRKRPHHAMEDAIYQSKIAEPILDIIDPAWRARLLHLENYNKQ